MQLEQAAKALKELGHPTRLAIYKRLVQSGSKGIAVGDVQQQLNVPGSTLSHHLSSLASAGLIQQRREGRTLFCTAEFEQLNAVIEFLQDQCCADELA
ncbi:ArsR/SmtB family transcription factor [Paraferrimonas haliotis]|uniref:Transcriptional regulator n=1 Tax=Paraferrimonas haliotis TaxID=2013866 RepID=A0AA37TRJ5_9GAMM|nr:metalloregulator ArsR/SmtB family transcription factor [Paraferrimonas haliotis]GLS83116.1 transcriptional regulator [Paraferrimonas haliotis]